MKIKKTYYFIAGAILLIALLVLAQKFSKGKGIGVFTTKVERRDIQESVLASGKIFPKTEVKISSDVSGEVVELLVKEGDTVRAGQLLARVNPDSYESAVERGRASVNGARAQEANARAQAEGTKARLIQGEAQLDQATAQFNNAKAIFDRNKKLFKDGVISKADLDASEASFLTASANVKSAKASVASAQAAYNSALESIKAAGFNVQNALAGLKELQTSLRKTSVFAPMDGVLSKLNIEKGERVVGTIQMAGTEMMRISDFSVMEAQVDVSETNVLQVEVGDKAEIEIDAYPDRKFTGRVAEIGNSASNLNALNINTQQATNFTVKIVISPESYKDLIRPDKPFPLRPGMSVGAEIFTDSVKNALAVPLVAVTTREPEEDKASGDEDIQIVVFKVSGDTVAMQKIKTGIQDDEFIEVRAGLNEGDEIVKGPGTVISRTLEDGMRVRVKKERKKRKK